MEPTIKKVICQMNPETGDMWYFNCKGSWTLEVWEARHFAEDEIRFKAKIYLALIRDKSSLQFPNAPIQAREIFLGITNHWKYLEDELKCE